MISIRKREYCCGCTACASICSHGAIVMMPDPMGFLYPKVDSNKCVNCGLCDKVCAFNDNYEKSRNLMKPEVYGVRHKDENEVRTSRSGAAFVAISDCILEQGGVIYGVGYINHFRVAHKRALTKEERNEFKGSKYVQSDLTGIFHQVKQDLKNGNKVLFSGTPCQTSALNSYVGKKLREGLILVDIVCHGVPAPNLWHDFIKYIEEKEGKKLQKVYFRDKERFGWAAHHETFLFKGDIEKKIYPKLFYDSIMFRPSCTNCHFCNTTRPSDITIADFWGWEKTDSTFNKDDKGINLILLNTAKGQALYNTVKSKLTSFPAKLENVLQPNLIAPTAAHPFSSQFERDYIKRGFAYVFNKDYFNPSVVERIVNKIRKFIQTSNENRRINIP